MKRSLWICMLLAVSMMGVASHAFAQMGAQYGGGESRQKYSVYAGFLMPAGSLLRDQSSSVWKDVGFGLNRDIDDYGRPGNTISLEYAGAEGDYFNGLKVGITYTKFFRKPVENDQVRGLYYGIGGGINIVRSKVDAQPFVFPPIAASSESGIQPSATLVGGYDFSEHVYAEIRYTKMPELAEGSDFSGLSISIGTRSVL